MASISNKSIVAQILESQGTCEDPPIQIVYRYETAHGGGEAFAIFTSSDFDDLKGRNSPYCKNVTCLMANGMLTLDGSDWMRDNT